MTNGKPRSRSLILVLATLLAGGVLPAPFPARGATPAGPPAAQPADLVIWHGKVHTQDATRSVVQAVAVRGNSIILAGSDDEARALIGPGTRTVDLEGRVVMPGIIDAHTHPAMSAQDMDKCSLEDKPVTPRDVKRQVSRCLKEHPGSPAQWVEVVMVNPSGLTLSASDLDAIVSDRPLLMTGSDGHTSWLNTRALQATHITAATADPAGGSILHDAKGQPTGTLRDNATLLADAVKPPADIEYQTAQLSKALDAMRATGITSVQDAAVDENMMQLYKRLHDAHQLNMRVRGSLYLKDLHEASASVVNRAVAFRARWAVDPDFLRADAVKIFADGVIEYPSQTAALLEPYLDAKGHKTANRGPSYFDAKELDLLVTAADAADLTVHIHAIGDRAVRCSLDAFAAARAANGARDNRDQIAHLELIDPADFGRFKQLDVIANFQLLWAQDDDYTRGATVKYIGPTRAKYLYPARSLRDAGAVIAAGSDWGVSSFNAFIAMEHAITRAEKRGRPALLPEQSLLLQDIVDAYTINAAFALKQEKTTGSLEPGKRADLIILDRDLFALNPYDIHDTAVVATYLDGREVYRKL
jgi:predicted amidohydrolase YtcJ